MIDIEPNLFDEISEYIAAEYPDMRVENEIIMVPEVLPMVGIEEIHNSNDRSTIDSGSNENYVNVDYEVRVYVNPTVGKRRKSRGIMSYIDSWFIGKGFERINTSFISFDDGTKYQTICQYSARTDGETIYRR